MKKKDVFLFLTIVLIAVFLMYLFRVGCPILELTGIPCFGCGMTRACISLVQFDFEAAWYYHPLSFFLPFFLLGFCFIKKMPVTLKKIFIFGVLFSFVAVYVLRLTDGENEIVKWHLEEGLIYKVISKVMH